MFFAMLGWGGSWVNAKVLSGYIDAYEMIFFRFFITALSMVPVIIYFKKSFKIDIKSLALVVLASALMLAYMRFFFDGTKLGTASLGGAFVTTLIPIITFVIMALLGKKSIAKIDVFALVLGAVGVGTILSIWNSSLSDVLVVYNLYFLIAALLWALLTVVSGYSTKVSPIVFTFYIYVVVTLFDALFLVDFSKIDYAHYDIIFWLNIGSLSLFATTFANTIYFLGIERLGASKASSFTFLVPLFAILLSVVFLKEHITFTLILGTIMALIAVKILNKIKLFGK